MNDKRQKIVRLINDMIHADPSAMTTLFNLIVLAHPDMDKVQNLTTRSIPEHKNKVGISTIGVVNAILQSLNIKKVAVVGKIHDKEEKFLLVDKLAYYEEVFPPEQIIE